MANAKVSIIIPNYNGEKYITECLDSVYHQKYKNFEVIIIDDGSTDNSVAIIEEYIQLYKIKNINFIKQNNMNASVARNKGIETASGYYLYFLDSDDIVLENGIMDLIENIEKNDADFCIGSFYKVDENRKRLCAFPIKDSKRENPMNLVKYHPVLSNKLFKKEIVVKNNIYFANVNIGQDLNFVLKYLACCDNATCIESKLCKYRIVDSSMSNSINFNIFDIVKTFEDVSKFYELNDMGNLFLDYIVEVQFKHYFWQMNKQVKCSNYRFRRLIVDYFCYNIKDIKLNKHRISPKTKRDYFIYKFNSIFKYFTCSKLYSKMFLALIKKQDICKKSILEKTKNSKRNEEEETS